MAARRASADVDPATDPVVDPDLADQVDSVDAVDQVGSDPVVDPAVSEPSDAEAAVVTGTWFKWENGEGVESVANGGVVIAPAAVIEQGVCMGLLARL